MRRAAGEVLVSLLALIAAACGARSNLSQSAAATGSTGGAAASSSAAGGASSVTSSSAAGGASSVASSSGAGGGGCSPVSCDMPPAPVCLSATTLRTFDATGTCVDGGCSYGFTDSMCPQQCSGGACTANGAPVSLSVGDATSCAVLADGSVVCWGELRGNPMAGFSDVPVSIAELKGTARAVTLGDGHACVLAGGVQCWGDNGLGQLGNGSVNLNEFIPTPVEVVGLGGGGITVISAATGGNHTCVVQNGGVKCWGDGADGQLGDGSMTASPVPVDVVGLPGSVVDVSAGGTHTCALTAGGGVLCWGDNARGQLGNGSTTGSPVPVGVVGLSSGVLAVSAGFEHTCAITASRKVVCWGDDHAGELGDGNATYNLVTTPIPATDASPNIVGISASQDDTCAFTADGRLACWGNDSWGQLGDAKNPNVEYKLAPVVPAALTAGVVSVSTGFRDTCAILSDGTAMCWGEGDVGELGNGATPDSSTPVTVVGL